MVAYTYKISPDQLAPQTLFELFTLIDYVKADEMLRDHWDELSSDGVGAFATLVHGEAKAAMMSAQRHLQIAEQKRRRE